MAKFESPPPSEYEESVYDQRQSSRSLLSASNRGDGLNKNVIAIKETMRVLASKLFVIVVMGVAAMLSSLKIFDLARQAEKRKWEAEFRSIATKIRARAEVSLKNALSAMGEISTEFTSYAIDQNASWPFVISPEFAARAEHFIEMTGADYLSHNPFLAGGQVGEWEEFVVANEVKIYGSDPRPEGSTRPLFSPKIISIGADKKPTSGIFPFPVYAPVLQVFPRLQFLNINVLSISYALASVKLAFKLRTPIVSTFHFKIFDDLFSDPDEEETWPISPIGALIYKDLERDEIASTLAASISWHKILSNALPDSVPDITAVLTESSCLNETRAITYRIEGSKVSFKGSGDLPDEGMGDLVQVEHLNIFGAESEGLGFCEFGLRIYPSDEFYQTIYSDYPVMYAGIVFGIFGIILGLMGLYDFMIRKRQAKLTKLASVTNNIIRKQFPAGVHERLMQQDNLFALSSAFYQDLSEARALLLKSKPIADYFPCATICFANISGFTAWASQRAPAQAFCLLEHVWGELDKSVRRRKLFKVESVGDSFVVASGLPEYRSDHADAMAIFARECRRNLLLNVFPKLELVLGPDTADLCMRFGLHSGPVTAGVLRGERSRFQLFGDTMNTASRIEMSAEPNTIHISKSTAGLLADAGKACWLTVRQDKVKAKGLGLIQTYYLKTQEDENESGGKSASAATTDVLTTPTSLLVQARAKAATQSDQKSKTEKRIARLIEWNSDVLLQTMKKIVASRRRSRRIVENLDLSLASNSALPKAAVDEVKEIISFSAHVCSCEKDAEEIELSPNVIDQVREYVGDIASLYHTNSFHNFEHASHVVQACTKLMGRIVDAKESNDFMNPEEKKNSDSEIGRRHDSTFGITSDPIIQFSCVFAALVHDVDHKGVPNSVLVSEGTSEAQRYKNKSVAEQNSVDLAWSMLMEERFEAMRSCIYTNQVELDRFRQLVVNSVMATDLVDKELGAARKARWAKAFSGDDAGNDIDSSEQDKINRKATIVIEHIIQASDVSHTMQHWHVFVKWNEKLFHELYDVYLSGRSTFDPTTGWYQGEINFFTYYVIPLAKKLADCGVFGVSSDECLSYALANRSEWERKGQEIVKGYIARHKH